MPRKRDNATEGRILNAAFRIWTRHGEKALTMREVARMAGTTTPTVYQRFRDKEDLLHLLRARARADFVEALEEAKTAVDTCRRFLEFAAANPNEYRLLVSDWAVRLGKKERKPSFELIKNRLAAELGGEPQRHARLALALGELLHGTATMILAEGVREQIDRELRHACMLACEALIANASSSPERWNHPRERAQQA